MVADDTMVIAESQYTFDNKALQLAENFFDIEDVSLLKVGTFGYTTAVLSHIMRNGVFHRDMLYNEVFLVSANLNSTVYNWAKILDSSIELATPSRMDISLKVPIEDLERISTASSTAGTKTFTITRDKVFDVGGYKFLLPYDIKLFFSRSASNQLNVTASYDFNNYNFKDASITTPYLKIMLSSDNGVAQVTVQATIFQIERREWIFTMQSNDILDVGILEQNYGGNLVSFRASYNANSSALAGFQDIETIFNEINQPLTERFAYYTFIGGDTIRLYFSNRPTEFRPAFNSKVKLETFTTSAEDANFNYSGTIIIRDDQFEGISYQCLSLSGKATGGASIKSFRESKIALMEQLRTRNNYTTTYDLETFFKQVKKTKLRTNSDFSVVKLRDDIFRRHFSLYVLQKNKSNELVPTNTVDITLSLEEIADLGYSLKPGTMIIYDRIESRYRILKESELPEMYLSSPDSYLFCIPFLINFDFKEFPKANIYFTNYSKTINLSYSYYNVDNPFEIVINSFNLYRNPLYDIDGFNLSCFLNTTSVNLNLVKIRTILLKNGVEIGYADLERLGTTSEYKLLVRTTDSFDQDGNYLIEETFKEIETGADIPEIKLNGTYQIKLAVLINDTTTSAAKPSLYARMPDLANYSLVSELSADSEVSFADDLTDIMYCQLDVNESTGQLNLHKVPLIGALFYLNDEQNTEVMNDMYENILMARSVSTSLENNTSIDVKFVNSSGLSRYFDIDTVDLRLKFSMALYDFPTKDITKKIKAYIAEFIEGCNDKAEKRFSISNLIKELETNFSEIKYIKFFSVNGGNIQSLEQIQYLNENTDNLPVDYVPEYISVRKRLPKENSAHYFDYDIDITYI